MRSAPPVPVLGCEKLPSVNRPFFKEDAMPDNAPEDRTARLEEANKALETRLVDLESRLMTERQKTIEAEMRRRGEEVTTANVENALKDMQEKLRREKREQELDAARQAAEARSKDLERRLNEERDMWVTMMKEHMARGGDNKPLLQEITALKAEMAQKDEQISALKEQALKGGGDQKGLKAEISSLKEMLGKQEAGLAEKEDAFRQLNEAMAAKEKEGARREQELSLQLHSSTQSLAEKEAQNIELQRQVDELRQSAERAVNAATSASAVGMEEERAAFQKKLQEQQDFQSRLALRAQELEREVGQRDALIQAVRTENEALQKTTAEMSAAKDAETRLMRENLQRLGLQNKELLGKLQEAVSQGGTGPSPVLGAVPADMKDMLSGLEDALENRDKMLENQQKSIDAKRGLIDSLFSDLKSLDEQAVALLEEKNRQTQEMNERVATLTAENERLRRLLEARPEAPPPAAPPAP